MSGEPLMTQDSHAGATDNIIDIGMVIGIGEATSSPPIIGEKTLMTQDSYAGGTNKMIGIGTAIGIKMATLSPPITFQSSVTLLSSTCILMNGRS
jgi:hypothetical protein